MDQGSVALELHAAYYDMFCRAWPEWRGVPMLKNPVDLMAYREILAEVRPALIVETGTAFGGSALYLASVCDSLDRGRVLSIDLRGTGGVRLPAAARRALRWCAFVGTALLPQFFRPHVGLSLWPRPAHPRITYLKGSSTAPEILKRVDAEVRSAAAGPVLVILDSDHHAEHVRAECELYGPLVTIGSYLIVEDTNINGHPIPWGEGPGPAEAVAGFLAEHPEFKADCSRERFLVTFNPGGYLKRVA